MLYIQFVGSSFPFKTCFQFHLLAHAPSNHAREEQNVCLLQGMTSFVNAPRDSLEKFVIKVSSVLDGCNSHQNVSFINLKLAIICQSKNLLFVLLQKSFRYL